MKKIMKFKNQKNSMKSKIKVRTSWGMTNSDCVLEQEITLNCENTNELIARIVYNGSDPTRKFDKLEYKPRLCSRKNT